MTTRSPEAACPVRQAEQARLLEQLSMDRDDQHAALTDKARASILSRAAEVQAAEGISNAAVARILGVSAAVWSQVKRRVYKGNADHTIRLARAWLADRTQRAEVPEVEFAATSLARQMMAVCRRAAEMPCVGLVVTRSGLGKTAALREFARRRPHRTVYLQAGEMFSCRVALLEEIAAALGVSGTGAAAATYRRVRGRMADLYAGGQADPVCLLIDEATTLRPSAINMLRGLHDDPACRPGLVLADTWRLDSELRRHGRDSLAGGYEQLTSRAGTQYRLAADAEVAQADVTLIADAVLAGQGHRGRISVASYRYLHKVAQGPGALRAVLHRIRLVADVAHAAGTQPAYSVAQLDFVAPLLGGACTIPHDPTGPFRPDVSRTRSASGDRGRARRTA